MSQHNFRTNLDNLQITTSQRLTYMTVVFCTKCGKVAYNANSTNKEVDWSDCLAADQPPEALSNNNGSGVSEAPVPTDLGEGKEK